MDSNENNKAVVVENLGRRFGNFIAVNRVSFDVANFHWYGPIDGDFEARLEQRFDEYKAVLTRHGVHKPIWVSETSTSSHPESVLSGASSEAIQARHVVMRLVIFSAPCMSPTSVPS